MKVPIKWLKEYVEIKVSPEVLAEKLTMAGTESQAGQVLELDILPNRGDLQSIRGVAREVAAVLKAKLKIKKSKLKEDSKKIDIKVEIKDKKLCPRYMARVIEDVKITQSPQWMQEKLLLAGMRPINNIVDVTNYVLLEYGQPLHAFDVDGVDKIVVRRVNKGEEVKTIDGVKRNLDPSILVIADSSKPIAIAGIMGGENTEVSTKTKNILLESAFFDPISINKTSQILKLRSESSVRFGKGVDWDGVELALDRAAALIAELGGGKILKGKIDKKTKDRRPQTIALRIENTNRLLGTKLKASEIVRILGRLGFKKVKSNEKLVIVKVPLSRSGDIEREVDLIEEVARIYGYNKINTTVSKVSQELKEDAYENLTRKIKEILVGAGLFEAQTFTILDPEFPQRLGIKSDYIPIANPLTEDESVLRTIMLPSILKVVDYNLRHQIEDIEIFEVGKIFHKKDNYKETDMLVGAMTGTGVDFSRVKGTIETLCSEFGVASVESIQNSMLHPNKSAGVIFNGKAIGWFGELNPDISERYNFKKPVFVFEINLEIMLSAIKTNKKYKPLPRFPKTDRDIAMFIKDGVSHASILETIRNTGGDIIEDIQLFDVYKNSRAYRVTYRDASRTLTLEEVNLLHDQVLKALTSDLGIELRK